MLQGLEVLYRIYRVQAIEPVHYVLGKLEMLTRRHFIQTTAALLPSSIPTLSFANNWPSEEQKAAWDAEVTPLGYDPATTNPWGLHPRFLPQRVLANDELRPGDIHVDAVARYLYHIEEGGTAMRYGVAIAQGDLYEPGTYTVKRMVRWPHWRPTRNMIERNPENAQYAGGVEPGPENALGSRAIYLYVGDRDTYLRIHGTPYPESIGGRASSGCVRMVMAHIIDLFENVEIGSTVYLYSAEESLVMPG